MAQKIWVTIDNIDGTSVCRGPYYPDDIDTMGMLMRLARKDIATITFTTDKPLQHLMGDLKCRKP